MKSIKPIILAVVLAVLVLGGWRTFFPNPQKVIRNRLATVAKLASFRANEEPVSSLVSVNQLGAFFSENVRVDVAIEGSPVRGLEGRQELRQAAMMARSSLKGLMVELVDVSVEVGADQQSATARMTLKARVPGEKDLAVQELKMDLVRVDRAWLISKVETEKTLTLPGVN